MIRFRYDVVSPLTPLTAYAPRSLSCGSTVCFPSGVSESNFRPTCGQWRPSQDISVPLNVGPVACDAALALSMSTAVGTRLPSLAAR